MLGYSRAERIGAVVFVARTAAPGPGGAVPGPGNPCLQARLVPANPGRAPEAAGPVDPVAIADMDVDAVPPDSAGPCR